MAYNPNPRLVKWTFIPLWVAWMINIFSHWGGRNGLGNKADGGLGILFGCWILWAGAFGDGYEHGRRFGGSGGPMPTWKGRTLFTTLGLVFIGVGVSLIRH